MGTPPHVSYATCRTSASKYQRDRMSKVSSTAVRDEGLSTMVYGGSAFSRGSWIRFFFFFFRPQNYFGIPRDTIKKVSWMSLIFLIRESAMKINCAMIAGVESQCSWRKGWPQHLKFHPEDPKKIMVHRMAPIYLGMHFICISRTIWKCSRLYFRERDKTGQIRTPTETLLTCLGCWARIFGHILTT